MRYEIKWFDVQGFTYFEYADTRQEAEKKKKNIVNTYGYMVEDIQIKDTKEN